jgi:hypothetical protein
MLRRSLCLAALLVFAMGLAGCLVTQSSYVNELSKTVTALSDCLIMQSTYVKKEEEASALAKTVSELEQKNKVIMAQSEKLQAENSELKKQTVVKDDLLQKKSEAIASQDAKQAEMISELERVKAWLAKVEGTMIKEPAPAEKKPAADQKQPRIEVLSGDGNNSSANNMAARLRTLGYRVESVRMAKRSDYPVTTVYYAAKYRDEAKKLASQLGQEAITKPLTWKSVFGILVVTGG